ncbi:hypothetical protein [Ruania alba]|uniref:hypothetical protein n=1 Tax=Ruania alba TaxID=648782 RepID=UPI0015871F57|nr:hypothetical protein [Ruania alba]
MPTDVVALVQEVIPQLEARGLRKPRTAAVDTAPARRTTRRTPARQRSHATA